MAKKIRPKLVDRAKIPEYLRDLESGLLEGVNLCEGCPYDYFCCRSGCTYVAPSEAIAISEVIGKGIEEFTIAREKKGLAKGFFVMRAPCIFFQRNVCTIYDHRPTACKYGICDYAYRNYEKVREAK